MIPKKYLEKEKEGKQQCQNCLEFGHWTYECTRPQTYVYRPSRTKLFKQNKFNLFEIKDEKKEDNSEKDKKNKSRSNSKSSSSSQGKNRSYSSGSSPNHSSRSYSSSSSSSSFSRSGHSENSNEKRRNEIIQDKKREKLNEMLDNIQKYDKNKKDKSRSHSHRKKEKRKYRSRSRSRSRERKRRENDEKGQTKELNNNYNNNYNNGYNNDFFKRTYKLNKHERWKKIEEIEMENAQRSKSPSYGRNGAFRKRPYE